MDISIIVPAYNEKKRLPPYLADLVLSIKKSGINGEIIVVDDGGTDDNYRSYLEIAESINDLPVKVVRHQKNKGKGAAIQTGFNEAEGKWIGFADADGATSADEVVRLVKIALSSNGIDGVFGSRVKMLGYNVERGFLRHLSGRIFTSLAFHMLHIPFYDSQCGCKFFRRSTCLPFLKMCEEQGWLLDIEIITLGYLNKLNFLEVPISWKDIPGSKVRLIKDSIKMAIGVWKIRKRLFPNDRLSVRQ